MPAVSEFSNELSLLYCLLLNVAVFGSAWFFSRRRMTSSGSQAVLDAALIGYAIQYVAIGVPGLIGILNFQTVVVTAMLCIVGLFAAAWKTQPPASIQVPIRDRFIVIGTALFVITFILAFAHKQADLPVISNDAMTYHFPAAVQWMQQRRIGLFQTWFFNPANTYSPLAGSMFILWLLLPFSSDVVARFVEVPSLLCVGIAMYRLCREIGTRSSIAALIAAAAVLCRPIFLPCMMAKDDLFVAFFIITSLVALSKNRADERWGAVRFGIAIGLLLATKYTALLSVPILLFAIDGPKWPAKKWTIAISTAIVLAAPWYLRNWIVTGNPVFPLGSLFTATQSEVFHSISGLSRTVIGGEYGLPLSVAAMTGIACLASSKALIFNSRRPSGRGPLEVPNIPDNPNTPRPEGRRLLKTAILSACSIGSVVAVATFFWRSPFPEVRFLLPVFCLLFACAAFSIEHIFRDERVAILLAIVILGLSIATLFDGFFVEVAVPFALVSLLVAAVVVAAMWWATSRARKMMITAIVAVAFFVFAYINWAAFCEYQQRTRFVEGAGYSVEYPQLTRLWNFVDQHIPADATVAYSNLYFVYPLQGGSLQRRMIYVPTRAGVQTIADLGWLGKNLSGEQLVPAAIRATVASPDRAKWLSNLQKSGAGYLIVGRSGVVDIPPEVRFARSDSQKFTLLFTGESGWIYQVNDPPSNAFQSH